MHSHSRLASSFSCRRSRTRAHGQHCPHTRDHDEHRQTDILTSGFKALPPPSRFVAQTSGSGRTPSRVWLEARSPLQWRNRPRFSRGSLTPGCDQSEHSAVHRFQRTMSSYASEPRLPSEFLAASIPSHPFRIITRVWGRFTAARGASQDFGILCPPGGALSSCVRSLYRYLVCGAILEACSPTLPPTAGGAVSL